MTLWAGTVLSARRYPQPFTERRWNASGCRTDRQLLCLMRSIIFFVIRLKFPVPLVLSGLVRMPSKFELHLMSRSRTAREKRPELDAGQGRPAIGKIYAMRKKDIDGACMYPPSPLRHKHHNDWSNTSVVAASQFFFFFKPNFLIF